MDSILILILLMSMVTLSNHLFLVCLGFILYWFIKDLIMFIKEQWFNDKKDPDDIDSD